MRIFLLVGGATQKAKRKKVAFNTENNAWRNKSDENIFHS
jgi:hypothetical protein